MEREWLAARLAQGRSLAAIAAEAGKGASTVAYWINKHGLVAAGRERHAPKGAVDEARLRELVEQGLSIRRIAADIGLSYTATRHHLTRLELRTEVPGRRRPEDDRWCAVHEMELRPYEYTRYRCPKCVADTVSERRRRIKAQLVTEAGGRCTVCGYDRYPGALQFHHVDPAEKAFAVSVNGSTRSLESLREEAAKCVLLCATCHAEVEAGVTRLPFPGLAE